MRLFDDVDTSQYNDIRTINGVALEDVAWVDTQMARNAVRYAVGDVLRVWDGPRLDEEAARR